MTGLPDEDMLNQAQALAADADAANAFRVDLEGYEGPLHLLLDLARRQKVDLTKISILNLADQYLDYIRTAQDLRVDLAAFKAKLGPDVAGTMITNPNTCGLFENDIIDIADAVHGVADGAGGVASARW